MRNTVLYAPKIAMHKFMLGLSFVTMFMGHEARANDLRLVAVPWYALTLQGGGLGVSVDDTVVVSSVQVDGGGQREFWIVERLNLRTSLANKAAPPTHQWIDGRKCAALDGVLAGATKLFNRGPSNMAVSLRIAPPSDIARLKLSAPAAGEAGHGGARISISEFFGPLATWWGKGSAKIESCWSDQPVDLGGRPAPSMLGSPSDASRWKAF